MACRICQRLEAELDRLERVHADTHRFVEDGWEHRVSVREFSQLRSAESGARLALEIARAELNRHKLDKHRTR
jgi:hypothetical protein